MSAITAEHGAIAAAAPPPPEVMPRGIALSAALHVVLMAVAVFGLPSLFKAPPPEETPIAVELVTIAPQTRATHPNTHRPVPHAKPEPALAPPAPKPERKPAPPPEPAPPAAAAAPPPPPPAPPKPEPKPAPPPPPPPKPVVAEAPPPPPVPKPKPEPKPEPRHAHHVPRPEVAPEVKKAETAAFDKLLAKLEERHEDKKPQPAAFDALLKNLTRQETAQNDDTPHPPPKVAAAAEPSSQPKAPLGSQLTASEKDMIIEQIERCWNVPAGARDAQDLDIEIKAVVNPDGTVRQAAIVDTGRYASDPFFRAAADSAKRAVLNPQCSPLKVPPDKYEAWHNLDLFFNPKDLL